MTSLNKKSFFHVFNKQKSIECDAQFESDSLQLDKIKSFGVMKAASQMIISEKTGYELYAKPLDKSKIAADKQIRLFYSPNATNESRPVSGLRLTNFECFKEISELFLSSHLRHKVLTLVNERLRIISIYSEIKVVHKKVSHLERKVSDEQLVKPERKRRDASNELDLSELSKKIKKKLKSTFNDSFKETLSESLDSVKDWFRTRFESFQNKISSLKKKIEKLND